MRTSCSTPPTRRVPARRASGAHARSLGSLRRSRWRAGLRTRAPQDDADDDQPEREQVDERDPGDRHDQEPDREDDARPAEPGRKRPARERRQAGGEQERRAGEPGRVVQTRVEPEVDLGRVGRQVHVVDRSACIHGRHEQQRDRHRDPRRIGDRAHAARSTLGRPELGPDESQEPQEEERPEGEDGRADQDGARVHLEEPERFVWRGIGGGRLVGRALQDGGPDDPEDAGRNPVGRREPFLETVHVAILLLRSRRLATNDATKPQPPAVKRAVRAPAALTSRPPASIAALYAACAAPSWAAKTRLRRASSVRAWMSVVSATSPSPRPVPAIAIPVSDTDWTGASAASRRLATEKPSVAVTISEESITHRYGA